ncbi:hypothetical protein PFICI_09285 [Pestalotiopsis fici W106-1]|uniref:Azaphilone pigments biosynthesis cluster protein L N-terminal domain-containing protein n=1 Tax=Pestalotiopsis fici (strain W106-1 / CGMCC3.15140) TaxID=1229662 RepID=W3X230_PESFW|nr:uncharacterized protein PFICI_09285 [Pestalotiopsis fici W106-1]ETS79432.1 hypothetical protein PFICI_09285 [Pestalotiopsis fici W106-1]
MDPVTGIGLASSCLGIITKIVSMGKQLDTFVKDFRSAPKDIIRLSEQLSIFREVLAQLEAWLKQRPDISLSMSGTVRKSLTECAIIIEDIHSHVLSVSPKPGEDSIGFWRRIRHLWAEDHVKEHERMISSQFHIFTLLVSLTPIAKWNVESIVQDEPNRELLKRGQADAQSILSARDNSSRFGQITIDGDLGLDQELSIDAEITQTGPYLENYRSLVHRLRNSKPDATSDLKPVSSSSRTDEDTSTTPRSSLGVTMTPTAVPRLDAKAISSVVPRKPLNLLPHWAQMQFSKEYRLREEENTRQHNEKVRQYNEKVSQLCLHAEYGGIAHMKASIDNGADVHGRNWRGAGPLEVAVRHGQVEAVRILLGAGADANSPMKDDKNKATGITKPLHLAVSMRSVEITELLINHNAAIQKLDAQGNSALHRAAGLGSVELVQLLIKHSADVHAPGLNGETPLHMAAGETVSTLLSSGAVIYAKNSSGEQPLVSAVSRGDVIAVKLLLSHGAPVNTQSEKTSLLILSQGHSQGWM